MNKGSVMLSAAKHLLFLVETNKADPSLSARDDIVAALFFSLIG
jgi:hypothetical protein